MKMAIFQQNVVRGTCCSTLCRSLARCCGEAGCWDVDGLSARAALPAPPRPQAVPARRRARVARTSPGLTNLTNIPAKNYAVDRCNAVPI